MAFSTDAASVDRSVRADNDLTAYPDAALSALAARFAREGCEAACRADGYD